MFYAWEGVRDCPLPDKEGILSVLISIFNVHNTGKRFITEQHFPPPGIRITDRSFCAAVEFNNQNFGTEGTSPSWSKLNSQCSI